MGAGRQRRVREFGPRDRSAGLRWRRNNPKLRVLIAHGWADLSCLFMWTMEIVSQIPIMGDPTRVQVHMYPGGHMYYARTGFTGPSGRT